MSTAVSIKMRSDLRETEVNITRRDEDEAVVEAVSLFLSSLRSALVTQVAERLGFHVIMNGAP